jgi:hypothetical protein
MHQKRVESEIGRLNKTPRTLSPCVVSTGSEEVRDCSGRSSEDEIPQEHAVTTASDKKFFLIGSFVVTGCHAEGGV